MSMWLSPLSFDAYMWASTSLWQISTSTLTSHLLSAAANCCFRSIKLHPVLDFPLFNSLLCIYMFSIIWNVTELTYIHITTFPTVHSLLLAWHVASFSTGPPWFKLYDASAKPFTVSIIYIKAKHHHVYSVISFSCLNNTSSKQKLSWRIHMFVV